MIIPYIMEHKKCLKPPTSYALLFTFNFRQFPVWVWRVRVSPIPILIIFPLQMTTFVCHDPRCSDEPNVHIAYPIVKPHVKWDNYPIIPLSHRIASISHYPIVWIIPFSHCKIPIQTPSTLVNEEPQHGTNTNVGKHPCHFATRGAEKDAELVLSAISTAWKLVLENQTILKIANSMFQTSVLW